MTSVVLNVYSRWLQALCQHMYLLNAANCLHRPNNLNSG